MACFTVPVGEAIVTTIAQKVLSKKEPKDNGGRISFSRKLGWLNKLLWGGSALLAFEHVWHGEITPHFPFLTAVEDGKTAEMLKEMATNGVTMALLVTAVWGVMCAVTAMIEKRTIKTSDMNVKDMAAKEA